MSSYADDSRSQVATEGVDLSEFQLRTLGVIAEIEGAPKGLAIKSDLEEFYGENVNHGRLYPNLDELVDRGLVAKGAKDRRTNSYELTESGRDVLRDQIAWLAERTPGVEVRFDG